MRIDLFADWSISLDNASSVEECNTCGGRLAGDAVEAVRQVYRVIVHRRQAASHGPLFAARQRYVEDEVAPPTVRINMTLPTT
ncbi:hypothetical protein, partial [Pseudomonas viridiflava]|uniref:hypothetical protein n=1 Tax=Pseudomonas viridiflava TaxID=33069 RepID=UPI00197F24C3